MFPGSKPMIFAAFALCGDFRPFRTGTACFAWNTSPSCASPVSKWFTHTPLNLQELPAGYSHAFGDVSAPLFPSVLRMECEFLPMMHLSRCVGKPAETGLGVEVKR